MALNICADIRAFAVRASVNNALHLALLGARSARTHIRIGVVQRVTPEKQLSAEQGVLLSGN
jgi:hypothetical protein